jgi:hypothetical protein
LSAFFHCLCAQEGVERARIADEQAEGVRPMRPLSATTPLPDRQGGDGSSKENGCEADPYVAGRNIFQQLPFVCLPKQPTDHSGVAGRNIFQQIPFACLPKKPTDQSGLDFVM